MNSLKNETAREWAERQFAGCQLGDWRRTQRAISIAEAMRAAPGQSLPRQMRSSKSSKAAYRFFQEEAFQYEDLISPHWEQTRSQARQARVVLLVQDLTILDYTRYAEHIQGLGLIGDNSGQGIMMTTVLGILPQPRQVLGIAYQEPFFRQPHAPGETRTQRAKRPKESDVWMHAVKTLGSCPEGVQWVHVGDRGGDIYAFFEAVEQQGCHFLVRACQDRRMLDEQGQVNYLLRYAAQLQASDEQLLTISAKGGRPGRDAQICLAYAPLTLSAGWMNHKSPPIPTWVIRVWEDNPPPGVEPIEWVLLTSVPTQSVEQAWERVEWYRCRWLVEEFHQCLKSGCQIEQRRLEEASSLLRLLGVLAPLAVQLLILKEQARLQPDQPADSLFPPDLIQLVAHLSERSPVGMTVFEFWRLVAMQGGYLGRKRDGPPGWKSLWVGWLYLNNLLQGFRLANHPDLF